jgi:hypothetical protein
MPVTVSTELLTHEQHIQWTCSQKQIGSYPYIRQGIVYEDTPGDPIQRIENGEVVGYGILDPKAPKDPSTKKYLRRVFYLFPCDQQCLKKIPLEAVDPQTVYPGEKGEITNRTIQL